MITLAQARERARRRYERHYVTWALAVAARPAHAGGGAQGDYDAGAGAAPGEEPGADLSEKPGEQPHEAPGEEPILSLPLHPPTERKALADPDAAVDWVAQWRAADLPGVVWEARRWASLGTQEVPVRLVSTDPAQVATIAGRTAHWRAAFGRISELLDTWSEHTADGGTALQQAVRGHAATLTALPEEDFARLRAVLRWLVDHPNSGAYIRQLPIRGVDTKWAKNHRGLVTALYRAITGSPDLGLADLPDLVRIRFLDPALAPAGLRDLSAPVGELDALEVRPAVVLVVENLETLVALPELPGTVVVLGAGHAIDRLPGIGWLGAAGMLLYWGDLDSHGFAILDRFRSHYPQAISVLMDRGTLRAHLDLTVPEPRPTRAVLTRLTEEEAATLGELRAQGGLRLEQERIDLATGVARLRRELASARTVEG